MIRFVTGIDTGVGKSIVVGLFARYVASQGQSVITQKIVQTGSSRPASDIVTHRKLMNIPLSEEDLSGLTCPYVFPYAASPHLAARLTDQEINPSKITQATETLAGRYDNVIVEGVGGLQVPLNDSVTVLDYLAQARMPTLLVTSSRLGSINHTLMSLELLKMRDIPLVGLVYNRFGEEDERIGKDSRVVFERAMIRLNYPATIVDLWSLDDSTAPETSFSSMSIGE